MSKFIGFALTCAFLCSHMSIAKAANDGGWVSCKDGLQAHGEKACESHGGRVIPVNATPIDTTQGLARNQTVSSRTLSNKTVTAKKTKTQRSAALVKPQKAGAKRTNTPTAKCMDGAMYFSTERRGACLKHGGIRSWYG